MDKTERKRTDIFRIMDENMLESSKKDVRSKAFFFPKRILWMKGQVQNSQALLEEREIPVSYTHLISVSSKRIGIWILMLLINSGRKQRL